MARHGDLERSVVQLFDPLEGRVEAEIDPLHHRNLEQPVADRQVVAAQDFFAAIDQRDVRAELVEDAGKFIGDIARARDQHALGDRVEMERLVGGDAMLMAGATRDGGMRADRDQDALGGLLRAVGQPHAVGTGDDGALVDDLDAVAFQRLLIGAVQAIDFGQTLSRKVAQRIRIRSAPASRSGARPSDPRRNAHRRRAASSAHSRE